MDVKIHNPIRSIFFKDKHDKMIAAQMNTFQGKQNPRFHTILLAVSLILNTRLLHHTFSISSFKYRDSIVIQRNSPTINYQNRM